jgi:hypothetical protein
MSTPTLTGEAARQYIENLKAQGVPVMKAHHDPRLLTMSIEEQQAYLADFLENGPPPEGPVRGGPPSADAPAPAAGGGFRRGVLALAGRSERYTLPNGDTLWAHPCSMEEAIWVNSRALADTGKAHGLSANDPGWGERDVQLENTLRAQVYQVIACCRQGPEVTDAKFFLESDADELRREPGYVNAVQEICALSDRLAGGRAEGEAFREAMARFFGSGVGPWLKTWHSLLTTDCSPQHMEAFLGALEDFADSASAYAQPTALSAGMISVLTWQLQQQTPSFAPSGESSGGKAVPELLREVVGAADAQTAALTVVEGGEE